MIRSFKDKEAEKIFKRQRSSKFPEILQRIALRKLRMLNRAANLNDLRVPPANRLEKLKGVDVLLEAISRVVQSVPDLKVLIAGSGSYKDELKNLVEKLNLKNNVKFLGFISEDKKYQYYKACKLVVVPTRWDCQPFTIFEAAACGVPVIVSDMANEEFVIDGETGLRFKSDGVEDLSNKILFLWNDDKLREKMGKSAILRAQEFDWSRIAERFVVTYQEIVSNFPA